MVHCKERWRNLRACLSRYIKQQSGSDPQHKPYYLFEHMAYLLPFLKSCRNSGVTVDGSVALANVCQQQHLQNYQQQPPLQHHQRTNFVVLKEQAETSNSHNNINSNNTNNNILNSLGLTSVMQTPPFQFNDLNQQQNLLHGSGFSDQHLTQMSQHHQYLTAIKTSMSEQDDDDEETMDAFDTNLSTMNTDAQPHTCSPNARSDTASASSIQNLTPEVQLTELQTLESMRQQTNLNLQQTHTSGADVIHLQQGQQHPLSSTEERYNSDNFVQIPEPKRIKVECHSNEAHNTRTTTTSSTVTCASLNFHPGERADMEFLRSILPDMACLTPQQKRKFKIGILELIDDIIEHYPVERNSTSITTSSHQNTFRNLHNRFSSGNREWRK